jgi:uncharacterized protein (TIGR03089 family)
MSVMMVRTFAEAVRRDPAGPLLTWYDDATGDRTELSGATLDNWVSKTANLFVDGAGLDEGDTVAVLLPPHWQTAAILLGAWSAGLTVVAGEVPQPVDVLFTTPDRVEAAAAWPAGERYATGLLPLAMPLRELPAGYQDYVTGVRAYGDHFAGHADVEVPAADLGIQAGDRVLIDAAAHPDPAAWLVAPLVAGASVVLCANLDAARLADRVAAEKVTRTLVQRL